MRGLPRGGRVATPRDLAELPLPRPHVRIAELLAPV